MHFQYDFYTSKFPVMFFLRVNLFRDVLFIFLSISPLSVLILDDFNCPLFLLGSLFFTGQYKSNLIAIFSFIINIHDYYILFCKIFFFLIVFFFQRHVKD